MLKKVFAFLTGSIMMGCKTVQSVFDPPSVMQEGVEVLEAAPIGACAPILGWLGGVCALGGMILLVISRGTLGWRPLIGGIAFILINYALAIYANWFFFPVAIAGTFPNIVAVLLAIIMYPIFHLLCKKTSYHR